MKLGTAELSGFQLTGCYCGGINLQMSPQPLASLVRSSHHIYKAQISLTRKIKASLGRLEHI